MHDDAREGTTEPAPAVDLDPNTGEFHRNRFATFAQLRRSCPVAPSSRHGGFWVVSDYDSVATVARDNETFAHKYEPDAAGGISYQGICGVPRDRRIPRQGVSEIDGPEHKALRHALNPWFAPARVEALRPTMQRVATWFLDQAIESGEIDLVLDYATPMPAIITLQMVGLPCDRWRDYADFFHGTTAHRPQDDEHARAVLLAPTIRAQLLEEANRRRSEPADDLATVLVQHRVDGRALRDEEIVDILWNIVAGGLDTTTALTAWALYHLDRDSAARRALLERPGLVPAATEEFLRFVSPNEALTRTVTRDTELGGQQLRAGDVVYMSWLSANHDEEVFDHPGELDFERSENRHLAFGLGGHRCIGSHLARAEFEVMLTQVLERIPDYRVDPERFVPYPPNSLMTGVASMPASFTPGPRVGPAEQPF
jgi:cytochrome P450